MGAAPRPSPHTVATQFVRVYYGVSSKVPARLSEFYGDISELNHGPNLRATGRAAIARLADHLPLAHVPPTIHSVVGQPSVDGNVVVVVRGVYGANHTPFSQTFLLAKQSDSHDEHFFCCNDVFVDIPPTSNNSNTSSSSSVAPARPANLLHSPTPSPDPPSSSDPPADPASPNFHNHRLPSSANTPSSPPSNPHPTPLTDPSPSPATSPAPATAAPVSATTDKPPASPVNSPASPASPSAPHSPDPSVSDRALSPPQTKPSVPSPAPDDDITYTSIPVSTSVASSTPPIPNGKPGKPDVLVDTPSAPAVPDDDPPTTTTSTQPRLSPPKKTWASIVGSNKDEAPVPSDLPHPSSASSSASAPSTPNPAPDDPKLSEHPASISSEPSSIPTPTPAPTPSTTPVPAAPTPTAAPTAAPAATPAPEKTPAADKTPYSSAQQSNNVSRPAPVNGRSLHMNRGGPRVFGPSAVVTLASTGMPSSDTRALTQSLRDEFSRYGHPLRGVEVKAAKGIAFIEYDTTDAVRTAVEMWAHGPRNDGAFAGVPLHVTEKRVTHSNRRPGSMRGPGRGGPRGGAGPRRSRPPAAPVG